MPAPGGTGPLRGLRVVEFAGLGPAPFAAMVLADLGAEVIGIERRPAGGQAAPRPGEVLARGRRPLALDLKQPAAVDAALRLIDRADVLIEGFRPGVMEKLGLGPQTCLARNSRLVYGRMTGWGQHGPLARSAGHDINYTALSGALHLIGRKGERPVPAPGLVGDFGGGGMLLAVGVLAALFAARQSGHGQVVDAAVTDGSALLAALLYGWRASGAWRDATGTNVGDGGPHFYDTYVCRDGRSIALGAIEPPFYAELLRRLGLESPEFAAQWDPAAWDGLKERMAALFAQKDRDAWCALLEGTDACFAPVLDLGEAPAHPHNVARATFAEVDGVLQPAPAPRFSATPAAGPQRVGRVGSATRQVLAEAGLAAGEIDALLAGGGAWQAPD